MSMRISNLFPLLLLAACGSNNGADSLAEAEQQAAASSAEDGRISCAVSGATAFSQVCSVEREAGETGLVLTLRHPDGGFRRLLVTKDGRGVVAADGAEPAAVVPVSEGLIEVSLGGDKYRLPATVKGAAKPPA